MTSVLYLTRNGLLEPLGQSQVLAYLRGLSTQYDITLITFEKDSDWADQDWVEKNRRACRNLGIRWLPQRFPNKSRVIGGPISILVMGQVAWCQIREFDTKLVHARAYIPASVALVLRQLTGVPFIFDMRALWPEELITAGRLRRGSMLHRAIRRIEYECLQRASAVVSLTRVAVEYLRETYPDSLSGQRFAVIPTCADLERFTPADNPPQKFVCSCIGTVLSGWFRVDWLRTWVATVVAREPATRFEILTREDDEAVRAAIDPDGRLHANLSVASLHPHEMPDAVQHHSASVMFFTDGLSKLGSSPTRMGEILGSGLPVIANAGVGDVADIISMNRVGVIVGENTTQAMVAAYEELRHLMRDPDLKDRCRATAEAVFSLSAGTSEYENLYQEILAENSRPE